MVLMKQGISQWRLQRQGEFHPLVMIILKKDVKRLLEDRTFWLTQEEEELYGDLVSDKKRRAFILGRYAAKLGLSRFTGNSSLTDFAVLRGALGQPLVCSSLWETPELSISHSASCGACLVYPPGHQFAMDLEEIRHRSSRLDAIASRLTKKERALLDSIDKSGDSAEHLYLLWTMKEALSKVLRCGLTLPVQALELAKLQVKDGLFHGRFTHFSQYRVIAQAKDGFALAIVFPWKSRVYLDDEKWI